ncbi:TerB family tellurite resistance protein [Pelagibius sp. Alg239-R121]|uniref:tellurite resistance TerB family protein n=1 Tax=Pelagibius sp. Alg239-R121 TaxID=2993448 RepID=UPI0024A7A10A|nr:TerB family tellurite resistance protein [Pelagibius sp. Alg239-R121]
MIERLKALLMGKGDGGLTTSQDQDTLQVAAAALLVEAALMDETFDDRERATIEQLLTERFELSAGEVTALLDEAKSEVEQSSQLFGFTRIVADSFDNDQRVELVGMLWQVAYADGELHDFEASLLRRLAGLLHVSDYDSGRARQAARAKLVQQDE